MNFFKKRRVMSLPATLEPATVYFVKSAARTKVYVTDVAGVAYGVVNADDVVNMINSISGNVQLELSMTGGVMSLTGGTQTVNLDTRYVKIGDNLSWTQIINIPTTRDGYGLTDVYTKTEDDAITGFLTNLNTTNKSNLVAAVNEIGSAVASSGLQVPQGLNCSGAPNYPAATVGQTWKVTVGGMIGGASGLHVEPNDMIICTVANTGGDQATVGSNFFIVQANVDAATTTVKGLGRIGTQTEVAAGTEVAAWVTPATLKGLLATVATSGNYTDLLNKPINSFIRAATKPTSWQPKTLYFVSASAIYSTYMYIDGTLVDNNSWPLSTVTRLFFIQWVGTNGKIFWDDLTVKDNVTGNVLYHADFETVPAGFTNPAQMLITPGTAHDGANAMQIAPGFFGNCMNSSFNLSNVTITLWVYDDLSATSGQIAFNVDDGSKTHMLGLNPSYDTSNTYNKRNQESSLVPTTVLRSLGWHEFKWVLNQTGVPAAVYITDENSIPYEIDSNGLNLDNILATGNVSLRDIFVGNITGNSLGLNNAIYKTIQSLGTDVNGLVGKSRTMVFKKVNANYTATDAEGVILADTTTAGLTVTLPASPTDGDSYKIRNIGTVVGNLATISTAAAINAAGTTSITLDINQKTTLQWSAGDSVWYEV